jgi:uncharacterized membrane protein
MDFASFSLILVSAVFHAFWNFFTKRAKGDKISILWAGWLIAGTIMTPISLMVCDLSTASTSWIPFLLLTTIVHAMYIYMLGWSYSLGEVSLIYPIARGIGILITVSIILFSGMESISAKGLFGIIILVLGIVFISIKRFRDFEKRMAMVVSAMVGCCISFYTIIDKISIIHIHPLLYISLMFLFTPLLIAPYMLSKMRVETMLVLNRYKSYSAMIGFVSLITYLLILFALQKSPTPYVAALREISIVFVAILGIYFLNEERNKRKIIGIALIILGAMIIKLS